MNNTDKFIGRVFLTTLPNGTFGGAGGASKTVDISKIYEILLRNSFDVEIVPIDRILEKDLQKCDVVFYTSSDEPNVRAYIKDITYFVSKQSHLVPSYEYLLAHENKGFQHLFRCFYQLDSMQGGYHFDIDNAPDEFPYVFKSVDGAGSKGVRLIHSDKDLNSVRKGLFKTSLIYKILKFVRRWQYSPEQLERYRYRHKGFKQYVWQQFVENLDCDYKVLVFGDKYFVLRRLVKKNDFRASGSGVLDFDSHCPEEVLEHAKALFTNLNTPFASFDLAVDDGRSYLIEFQMLNFGPKTLVDSRCYYQFIDQKWTRTKGESDLAVEFGNAFVQYLNKTKLQQV